MSGPKLVTEAVKLAFVPALVLAATIRLAPRLAFGARIVVVAARALSLPFGSSVVAALNTAVMSPRCVLGTGTLTAKRTEPPTGNVGTVMS